jgi:hypothetical protein
MPTYEKLPRFTDDYKQLTEAQKKRFKEAVRKFIKDLARGEGFRAGLRVKGIEGTPGIFEMTWAPDGRATFHYGEPLHEGEPHIVWRRVGTHTILGRP